MSYRLQTRGPVTASSGWKGCFMKRGTRLILPAMLLVGALAGVAAERSFSTWSQYLGGADSSQYSSLRQINKSNVKQLEVAWTYPTGMGTFTFDPIVIDGVMYVLSQGNAIVALDAA